jgi:hypothetical protein
MEKKIELTFLLTLILISLSAIGSSSVLNEYGVTASTHDGNVPENTLDNDLSTRWSAEGDGQWIRYDLGELKYISDIDIAFYQGNTRTEKFNLGISKDRLKWELVYSGESSGKTSSAEKYNVSKEARYVK